MRKLWRILNCLFILVFLCASYTSFTVGNMLQTVKYGLFILTCFTEVLQDTRANDKGLVEKLHYVFILMLLLWHVVIICVEG